MFDLPGRIVDREPVMLCFVEMIKEPYSDLATAYDTILSHVDYQSWYLYISGLMIEHIDNPRTVLELGCGTGKFGAKFSADDFEIYGIDLSVDMLRVAKARAFKNFRLICSDLKNFRLAKKVDFIFCVHDTLNYLLEYEEIQSAFSCVREAMHEKSIFMFDITTEYNIKQFFEGKNLTYNIRGTGVEWTNSLDKKNKLVHSILRFMRDDGTTSAEHHVQRLYSIKEIKKLLDKEGFEVIDILSDYSHNPPSKETVMINFITRLKKQG